MGNEEAGAAIAAERSSQDTTRTNSSEPQTDDSLAELDRELLAPDGGDSGPQTGDRPSPPGGKAGVATGRVVWYKSLTFLGLLGLTLVPLWDMAGIVLVMENRAKPLVVEESARLIEQIGNGAIDRLLKRSREIESLGRSMAAMGQTLPKSTALFQSVVPNVVDFNGDKDVAGGGVWPEPYTFDPGRKLRSFFYGREKDGTLKYYDDYNSGRGYLNDEWYPVVRYSKPGKCFWSKSYMDPYSYQPMVTCTVAMRESGRFSGVATVDLKLEGLHGVMESIRKSTGGYVFLTDRNNKFLTFPETSLVKKVETDAKGKRTEEFLHVNDLVKKKSEFTPIAAALESMNTDILATAQKMKGYDAKAIPKIDGDSDQINLEEAQFIAAVIADPMQERLKDTYLYKRIHIKRDFITGEESLVFLFHVPESYWKMVVVKPLKEAEQVARYISRDVLTIIGVTILVGVILAALLMHRFFTRPLRDTTEAVQAVGSLVQEKKFGMLDQHLIKRESDDELGQLAVVINSLARELQDSYGALVELNQDLEKKVEQRTAELRRTLQEVSALKFQQDGDYFLTSLLIEPLAANRCQSELVFVETFQEQKKTFKFRHWESQIGGDVCICHSIRLRGRDCTVVLNGDAMGKSMQGAGGALVLGAVFDAIIERTKVVAVEQQHYPERWLKNAVLELQKVFESFNGSMLVSAFVAVIDDLTGFMCHVNAEHPVPVLFRDGQAGFLPDPNILRKFGTPMIEATLAVQTDRLLPGDVLVIGSDGRDDLGMPTATGRRINEDEGLFVRLVQQTGAQINPLVSAIREAGEVTDDLSLIRVAYRPGEMAAPWILDESHREGLRQATQFIKDGRVTEALAILEGDLASLSAPPVRRLVIRALGKAGRYQEAASLAESYLADHPEDSETLLLAAYCHRRAGHLAESIDAGERLRLREPGNVQNLRQLVAAHQAAGNEGRASGLRAELEAVGG